MPEKFRKEKKRIPQFLKILETRKTQETVSASWKTQEILKTQEIPSAISENSRDSTPKKPSSAISGNSRNSENPRNIPRHFEKPGKFGNLKKHLPPPPSCGILETCVIQETATRNFGKFAKLGIPQKFAPPFRKTQETAWSGFERRETT